MSRRACDDEGMKAGASARPAATAAVLLLPWLLACRGPEDPDTTDGTDGGTLCVPLEAADDTAGEPPEEVVIPFPAALDVFDLPHTYFGTSGHGGYTCEPDTPIDQRRCALDIHALRWDPEAGSYTRSRTQPGEPDPLPFSDDVMWGAQLRSPVDGEVVACWRGMPDDDDDTDDIACPGGERACIPGGNHLQIVSDDGELYYYGHLQQDSIPLDVCPIDEVYLYDDDPKTCAMPSPWEGMRQSSRLDLRGIAPVRVTRGQVVGRVGTSGTGQGVHVHVHRKPFAYDDDGNPCEAPSLPLAFETLWVQPRDLGAAPSGDWQPNHGQRLPIDGSSLLLWPDAMPPQLGCN